MSEPTYGPLPKKDDPQLLLGRENWYMQELVNAFHRRQEGRKEAVQTVLRFMGVTAHDLPEPFPRIRGKRK